MRSPRYTILIANRNTGAIRRLTVARRTALLFGLGVMTVPLLMGLGVGGASQVELDGLRSANENLKVENESYRAATGELADQISTLQAALSELGDQAELDPATKAAIDKLPAIVKSRAMGGGATALAPAGKSASVVTPDSTFGILRDLLGVMEDRLVSVRTRIESQQALARATPSIWPVTGWLSSRFGNRKDPFDGSPDFHPGLDISADKGTPVRATADGTVESAGYNGNYGNSIVLSHGFGIGTRFGHLSGYAVTVGQKVRRGDVIGYVGSTGRATSAHLHYEILLNGQPIDPLRLLARP
jgi:murein DD-endopeptidase MepM/ murein hydrolase activator NlpD